MRNESRKNKRFSIDRRMEDATDLYQLSRRSIRCDDPNRRKYRNSDFSHSSSQRPTHTLATPTLKNVWATQLVPRTSGEEVTHPLPLDQTPCQLVCTTCWLQTNGSQIRRPLYVPHSASSFLLQESIFILVLVIEEREDVQKVGINMNAAALLRD